MSFTNIHRAVVYFTVLTCTTLHYSVLYFFLHSTEVQSCIKMGPQKRCSRKINQLPFTLGFPLLFAPKKSIGVPSN